MIFRGRTGRDVLWHRCPLLLGRGYGRLFRASPRKQEEHHRPDVLLLLARAPGGSLPLEKRPRPPPRGVVSSAGGAATGDLARLRSELLLATGYWLVASANAQCPAERVRMSSRSLLYWQVGGSQ